MIRLRPILLPVLVASCLALPAAAHAAQCSLSPMVQREISRLNREVAGATSSLGNRCAAGTAGRAQQAYYTLLSIGVHSGTVADALKSIGDTSQNHALAHDIREYEKALSEVDQVGRRAMELCASDVMAKLSQIKKRFTDGDTDTVNDGVLGIRRLRRVWEDAARNSVPDGFYQPVLGRNGKMVSYYDRESPHACTLPQYGLSEFKTIFTRFLDTLRNFRKMAKDIEPREGAVLYREFLREQELMGVKDFYQVLVQDTRENQIVDSPARSTVQGRVSDIVRHRDDRPATIGGMVGKAITDRVPKLDTQSTLFRVQRRNEAFAALSGFTQEDTEMVQRINRQSATRFLLYEALLSETDQILRADLCRKASETARFMVRACNRTSACAGQVCDETEPMRSCSP